MTLNNNPATRSLASLSFSALLSIIPLAINAQTTNTNDTLERNETVANTMTVKKTCSNTGVKIVAQSGIQSSILESACRKMKQTSDEFHKIFNTRKDTNNNYIPVADDNNSTLEMLLFSSSADYKRLAPKLYDMRHTDNGGISIEGDPASTDNKPRLYAHLCDEVIADVCESTNEILNLKHEFTHYLDSRYNLYGKFNHHNYSIVWVEGLAEYVGFGKDFSRSKISVKGDKIKPLYNVMFGKRTDYSSSLEFYAWSYYGFYYLHEKHPNELKRLRDALSKKTTNRDAYKAVLTQVVNRTENGFTAFMKSKTEAVEVARATIPDAGKLGDCNNLLQPYRRPVDSAKLNFQITNNRTTPIKVIWVSYLTGVKDTHSTINIPANQTKTINSWKVADRVYIADNSDQCIGIGVLASSGNNFTISAPPATESTNRNQQSQTTQSRRTASGNTNQTGSASGSIANQCQNQAVVSGTVSLSANTPVCLPSNGTIHATVKGLNRLGSFAIKTDHGSGNLSLYYKSGGWPTTTSHQSLSTNSGNRECIALSGQSESVGYVVLKNVGTGTTLLLDTNDTRCP